MVTIEEVLSRLKGVSKHDGYWTALCPAHDDKTPSLSVSVGEKQPVVLKCHAGCSYAQISHAMGFTVKDLRPDHGLTKRETEWRKKGRLVAKFNYEDADGVLVYQACRFETDDGKKTFDIRRPDGEGGWIHNAKGIKRVPYRLPELIKAHASELTFVAEGEKKVDRLRDMGFTATCNVGGAGKWLKGYAQYFVGRDVVILPDNDDAGRRHAALVYSGLKDAAKSVRQVELPNLPEKGDVIDWLAAGGTADQLKALVETASAVIEMPPREITFPVDEELLEKLGLSVFGEDEDGRIKVFSEQAKKSQWIRDIDKMTSAKLIQLCGPEVVREHVYTGRDETPDGMYRIPDVRGAIAAKAYDRRISELSELGSGVWSAKCEKHEHECIVLVNSGEAAVLNQRPGLQRHLRPWYGEHVLDFGNAEWWFDREKLSQALEGYTPDWAREVVDELNEIYGRWWFGRQLEQLMPALLSGLTLATWTQTIWKWRPQVFILGKSNTGKTTLFEFLAGTSQVSHGLFGNLVISTSDTTAAGIQQTLKNSAKILVLDEVESSRKRDEIYRMLRNAGRGGKSVRGTSHQRPASTGLKNIAWVAATESGLKKEADRNRFIIVNLLPPPSEKMGLLKLPNENAMEELGLKTLAVAVKTCLAARELAEQLVDRRPRGFHHRLIESYAVPAACYAKATGMSDDDAFGLLEALLATTDPEDVEGDEERVLKAILDWPVDIRPGNRQETVSSVIHKIVLSCRSAFESDEDEEKALGRFGLSVFRKSNQPAEAWIDGEEFCLFVNCSAVEQHVLARMDEWKGGIQLRELLLRRERAVKCRRRISGIQKRGVLLPMSKIHSEDA